MVRWQNPPPPSPFTTALSCGFWMERTSGCRSVPVPTELAGSAATRSLWLGADFDCDTHNHCRARFRHRETARSPSKETLYANRSVAHSRGANRAVLPRTHRRGQRLQSEAPNAENAPESAICGVLRTPPTPTGSVPLPVPIPSPRSAPRELARTNLRSDPCYATVVTMPLVVILRMVLFHVSAT